VDGTLVMEHARITYLSGSTSQCLRRSARAIIRNSTFSHCDGCALNCINVDGGQITIENSDILCSGNWGLIVQGSGGAPLDIRDCVFESQLGDILITGESASVRLIDCGFDPNRIIFNRDSGQAVIAWTRQFQVVDAASQAPRPGVLVRARPNGQGGGAEVIEQRTDADGCVKLVLMERFLRPGGTVQSPGSTLSYEISAIDTAGAVLAGLPKLTVRGKESRPILLEAR